MSECSKPRYRHELKFIISEEHKRLIQARLPAVMQRDQNADGGEYQIRSLYFDDLWETAYVEKQEGTAARKKYRIRIYNYSDSVIKLERKRKQDQYINKVSARLTREDITTILRGDYQLLLSKKEEVCSDFYLECMTRVLRPRVIVDYEREAYVFPAGDVRITFDSNVRSGLLSYDLFDQQLPVLNALEPGQLIMEVKFTQFLPHLIRDLLPTEDTAVTAASKYVMCMEKRKEYMR